MTLFASSSRLSTDTPLTFSDDTAILLLNTGSPSTLSTRSVRQYLTRFLTDPRIIGLPAPLRHLLVRGLIAPLRAPKSREKYRRIWTPEGPLLRVYTERLARAIAHLSGTQTLCAMRYEKGSTAAALDTILSSGKRQVILLPLFPHYAISSFESAVLQVRDLARKKKYSPLDLRCVSPYYAHPSYIGALASSLRPSLRDGDHLLLSFHGIPLYQVTPYSGDTLRDYPYQCLATVEALLAHPLLSDVRDLTHEVCYQSRFGHHEWLSPATIDRVKALPSEGKSRIVVTCPSFVCDCLESVDEIGYEAQEEFVQAGGIHLDFVPCLNAHDRTAQALIEIAKDTLALEDLLPRGL